MIGSSLGSHDESAGLANLTVSIFKSAGKKVSLKKIHQYFSNHPFPSSLQAAGQLFASFNVDHLHLSIDPDHLSEMQFPLLTSLSISSTESRFILLNHIEQETVNISLDGKIIDLPMPAFMEQWRGNELLLFSTEEAQVPEEYTPRLLHHWEDKIVPVLGLLIFFVLLLLKIEEKPALPGMLASSFLVWAGLFTVLIIAYKEAGNSNKWLNRFCKNEEIDTCDLLLHSSYAQILPGVSWTSIGFVFFSGVLTFFMISPVLGHSSLNLLHICTLLSIPGIAFSLFIQGFLSDYWCRLCLLVQGILISWVLYLSWYNGIPHMPDLGEVLFLSISILVGVIVWSLFSRTVSKKLKAQAQQKDLWELKFHERIVSALFGKHVPSSFPYETHGLVLGKPDASLHLHFISNPSCPRCSKAHEELIKLWKNFDEDISVELLFHLYESHEHQTELIQAFQELFNQDTGSFLSGLHQWYADIAQTVGNWKENLKGNVDLAKTDKMVSGSALPLIEDPTLSKLPTIYMNGHKVPDAYHISDLELLIPMLQKMGE